MKDDKLYRITFSKSLAEYICETYGYELRKVKLYLNPVTDDTKLFVLCKLNGWTLRVTLFEEMAKMWKSPTTMLQGCKIQIIE